MVIKRQQIKMAWIRIITSSLVIYQAAVYAYDHSELFPSNDEYNFEIFNSENLYGAPYGGFSRASRSRLAKLPLHLSDSTGFEFLTDEYGNEIDEKDAQSNDKSIAKRKITHSKNAPHFNIRDGDGRKFACRVYKEDELTHASAASSMFDLAIEYDAESTKNGKQKENQVKKSYADISALADKVTIVQLLDRILPQLEFDCLIHNNGWWKYRWCDTESVVQYHEDSKTTITHTLGLFKQKMIMTTATEDHTTLIQEFTDGDTCEETGEKRRIKMEISCCKVGHHTQMTQKAKENVHFITVQEQKICHYTGSACSPLLCPDNLDKEKRLIVENITAHIEEVEQASFHGASVRDIVIKAFDGNCVMKNTGWWTYEYCHLKQLRQFHANAYLDQKTASTYMEIETEHSLGKYNKKNDSYDDEEEKHKMINSPLLTKEAANKNDDDVLKKLLKGVSTDDANGSNRAAFVQEYTNGDVCDHEDVTDAAIKGGNVVNGGIERATTIRFFCGPSQSLESINEDSTCHYVMDITLPELCHHPFFKMEVGSTEVLKCLPVNEFD